VSYNCSLDMTRPSRLSPPHNLFVYESEPSNSHRSIGDITVRFADGTVEPVG
jgi:hypothetical protein